MTTLSTKSNECEKALRLTRSASAYWNVHWKGKPQQTRQNKIMKGVLISIGGFVAGILVTFFTLFIIGMGNRASYKEYDEQVQYIEVKGKKGNVRLYTGMNKDSV